MKKIITKIFCVIFISTLFVSCNFLAAGSYPYAEIYELEIGEKALINIINEFKTNNSQFQLDSLSNIKDGRRDKTDHWYHIYFYNPDKNTIFKTWVRGNNKTTSFALIGCGNGRLSMVNYKEVNRDYSSDENALIIAEFEEKFLNPIEEDLIKYKNLVVKAFLKETEDIKTDSFELVSDNDTLTNIQSEIIGVWKYTDDYECPDFIDFKPDHEYAIYNDCGCLNPKNPVIERGYWQIRGDTLIFLNRIFLAEGSEFNEYHGTDNKFSFVIESFTSQNLTLSFYRDNSYVEENYIKIK